MAKNDKKEQPILVTPFGTLVFANLTKPRDYKGNGDFAYDTGFLLDGAQADEFIAQIDAWMKDSQAESKLRPNDPPYTEHTDKEKNVVPGVTKFKFKLRAETKLKNGDVWKRKPKLVDADAKPIEGPIRIGNGTRARIKYQPYFSTGGNRAGVVLQPLLVQIVDLKGGSDEDYTIDAVEAGSFRQGQSVADVGGDESGETARSGREF
jgi:hypothetical protein